MDNFNMDARTSDEISWEYFELNWGDNFKHAKDILGFFEVYSKRFAEFGIQIQTKQNIIQAQKDWIHLLNLIKGENEHSFFKPYWMPLDKDRLDLFIDLSDKKLPIFETFYYMLTDKWFVSYLTHDITEVMVSFSKQNSRLSVYMDKSYDERMEIVENICTKKKGKVGKNG